MAEAHFSEENDTDLALSSVETSLAGRITELYKQDELDAATVDEAVEGYLRSVKDSVPREKVGKMIQSAFERQGLATRKGYVLDEVMEKYKGEQ